MRGPSDTETGGKLLVRLADSGRNVSTGADESFRETSTWAELLCQHIKRGTRPRQAAGATPRRWKPDEFRAAIGRAGVEGVAAPSARTLRNWCNGDSTPHERTVDAIEKVLFADDPLLADDRGTFRKAWEDASRSPKARVPKGEARTPEGPMEPQYSREAKNLRLVDMTLETMPDQGSTAEDFQALLDLRDGTDRCEDIPANVEIGVTRLTIEYDSSGCQPTGARYGDGGSVEGIKAVSGGWDFFAKPGQVLTAHFVEVLGHFQRTGDGASPALTVKASTHTDDLLPVFREETDRLPGKLKGVLGKYLIKKGYPRKGTIGLGSASLRWALKK